MDEAGQEPEFLAYRLSLIKAIDARDSSAVLVAMSPVLRRQWSTWLLTPSDNFSGGEPGIWTHLKRLLDLGGTFTTTRGAMLGRREFCAPYVYSAYPYDRPEALRGEIEPWVVLGDKVPVYAERDPNSVPVTYLSYAVVNATGLEGPDVELRFWANVEWAPNRWGHVLSTQIRAPNDYHACFAQLNGRWHMVRFERGITPAWTAIR